MVVSKKETPGPSDGVRGTALQSVIEEELRELNFEGEE